MQALRSKLPVRESDGFAVDIHAVGRLEVCAQPLRYHPRRTAHVERGLAREHLVTEVVSQYCQDFFRLNDTAQKIVKFGVVLRIIYLVSEWFLPAHGCLSKSEFIWRR